jgi:dolichol-phosphate mannosyltransferase
MSPSNSTDQLASMCTLTLVVPCYNEEATLAGCIERVLKLRSKTLKLEIIIVDDCSKDRSLEIARDLEVKIPEIRVLHHEVNKGKGAALRTGFECMFWRHKLPKQHLLHLIDAP